MIFLLHRMLKRYYINTDWVCDVLLTNHFYIKLIKYFLIAITYLFVANVLIINKFNWLITDSNPPSRGNATPSAVGWLVVRVGKLRNPVIPLSEWEVGSANFSEPLLGSFREIAATAAPTLLLYVGLYCI